MTAALAPLNELYALAGALCEGTLDADHAAQLESLVLGDADLRRHYIVYMQIHASAEKTLDKGEPTAGNEALGSEADPASRAMNDELPRQIGISVDATSLPIHQSSFSTHHSQAVSPIPPIIIQTLPSPASSLPSFISGWPVAYLVATVIFGVGLVIAAFTYVSQPVEIVQQSTNPQSVIPNPSPSATIVGRITGMVECVWESGQRSAVSGQQLQSTIHDPLATNHSVTLGDRILLKSGLLELTYDTGARVILQGPVTYEVESAVGGFLSVGKLTARLDSHSEISNLKSQIPGRSPLSTLHSPLFTIHTPTATVTDLGTEFGVEVGKAGNTVSHVFRGHVEVRLVEGGNGGNQVIQLGANESASVEHGQNAILRVTPNAARAHDFARRLPQRRRIQTFNTGIGLEIGAPDPYWQAVAISNRPDFKPCPARVAEAGDSWLSNDSTQSQWITFPGDNWKYVDYTYRTTFDLSGLQPNTAAILGRFVADNYVRAIRINGRDVPVPPNPRTPPFDTFRRFSVMSGFIEGLNTLEIDVGNNQADSPPDATSPLGLRIELSGSALEAFGTLQKGGENKNQ
jgi:hypothetical protein